MKKAASLGMRAAIAVMVGALAASGCARDQQTTGSIGPGSPSALSRMSAPELDRMVRSYGDKYEKRPKDKTVGLAYATLLRMTGRDEQALAVTRQLVIHHPKDDDVLSAYGKALAATGDFTKALDAIERVQRPDRPDWRLVSARGAILDQLGRPDEAREAYRHALDLKPNEPTVLSNLGMSYLLTNDLSAAETYLRKANGQPGADSRVRQNLALVVGLQGRFDEAERIAAAELPAEEARANVAYLRKMLSQQNAWSQLSQEDAKKTN